MKRLFIVVLACLSLVTAAHAAIPATTEMTFDATSNSYVADFVSFGEVFDGGVASFVFNLPNAAAVGTYHVTANFGGSGISLDWLGTNLNGVAGSPVFTGAGVDFGFITTNTEAPFVLNIFGTTIGAFHALGGHIDAFAVAPSVSAVPEAQTYAMFLAGLGMIGFIACRRKM